MRVAVIQGTRPEIVKNYSIVKSLRALGIPYDVLHTSQHRARCMSADIYAQMEYAPDFVLQGQYRIGKAIDWLQKLMQERKISHVIVNGDTAASIAGALAAIYLDIEVSHVEAGLRSADKYMLEERNRIMVDSVAQSLFAYTELERDVLLSTRDIRGDVYLEGNTTVDVLHDFSERYARRPVSSDYLFATMHRKEFTDSCDRMRVVFGTLNSIAENGPRLIFPIHPRTADAAARHGINLGAFRAIEFVEPMSIFDVLAHQRYARAVLTDSGCIQEEAYLLGVPCVTIRENTERHLTVAYGANAITGFDSETIRAAVDAALSCEARDWPRIYGTPGAGRRIVDRVADRIFGPSPAPAELATRVS
jgi:UDP-N-acetylglucosamine 2-epimerase (non-hydrolysing)